MTVARTWDQQLLTALAGTSTALRLPSLSAGPRLCQVALLKPNLSPFLAVPIQADGSVYAYLYLANRQSGPEFSIEDEHLLTALANTAAIAVTNAHLYGKARRQGWAEASEIEHQLLASESDIRVLEQIADSVARLAEADTVQIVLPVPHLHDTLEFAVSRGIGAEHERGLRYPATGSIAWEAMHHPAGLVLNDVHHRLQGYADTRSKLPIANLMAFPLQGQGEPRGSVVVCRANHRPFAPLAVELTRAFTNQAALALELADARTDQARLRLLEDRDRIS